jgi:hypothetical protein
MAPTETCCARAALQAMTNMGMNRLTLSFSFFLLRQANPRDKNRHAATTAFGAKARGAVKFISVAITFGCQL